MKNRIGILMMLSVLSVLSASALTIQEAREKAADHYPLVRDYDLIALTEQYTIENAAKSWLPQVQIGAQATWQTDVASYPKALTRMLEAQGLKVKGIDKFQYKATVDVQQTIWDGGRIRAAQNRAKAEADESRVSDEVELYQLRQRVDNLFFGILLLEQQRDALNQTILLLDANLEKMNSLVRNGVAMQSDADAVNVERLSTMQQLSSVESNINAYRAILGLYIGENCDQTLTEPEEILPPDSNDADLRPEMSLMDSRIATIEAREAELNKSIMPTIGAFAQGFFGYPGLNFMEAMMKRNPTFNAIVGVSASWNIGSLYTKKNELNILQANRQHIDVARDVFRFNVDLQATQQRNELQRLKRISASDPEILALRQRVRQAAESRLKEGVAEPTDLLLRITEEKNARIAANTHKIEYLKTLYSLQTTLNR